jgi:hypothetical protein
MDVAFCAGIGRMGQGREAHVEDPPEQVIGLASREGVGRGRVGRRRIRSKVPDGGPALGPPLGADDPGWTGGYGATADLPGEVGFGKGGVGTTAPVWSGSASGAAAARTLPGQKPVWAIGGRRGARRAGYHSAGATCQDIGSTGAHVGRAGAGNTPAGNSDHAAKGYCDQERRRVSHRILRVWPRQQQALCHGHLALLAPPGRATAACGAAGRLKILRLVEARRQYVNLRTFSQHYSSAGTSRDVSSS